MTTGDEALFGGAARAAVPPHPRGPERYRVEIIGLGSNALERTTDGMLPEPRVRVALVDAETGKRIGASVLPFSWLRDVAHGGTATMSIWPGVWE